MPDWPGAGKIHIEQVKFASIALADQAKSKFNSKLLDFGLSAPLKHICEKYVGF